MAAVVVGATAFGFLGLFSRYFMDAGLNALDTVVIRISIALLILTPILLLSGLDSLRISRKDIPIFLLFGFFKLMSDITFFYAQSSVTLCLATLLQMTAPFYVMFVSFVIFREKITIKKMASLTLAIAGCIMVTGVLTGGASAEISGVLSALVSGLFFGMFMIGGRITFLRNIKPETGLFYTFLVAAVFALPFSDMGGIATAIIDYEGLFNALMLGGAMCILTLADERYMGMQLIFLASAGMLILYEWILVRNLKKKRPETKKTGGAETDDGGFEVVR